MLYALDGYGTAYAPTVDGIPREQGYNDARAKNYVKEQEVVKRYANGENDLFPEINIGERTEDPNE